jgi:hypothetical protein
LKKDEEKRQENNNDGDDRLGRGLKEPYKIARKGRRKVPEAAMEK